MPPAAIGAAAAGAGIGLLAGGTAAATGAGKSKYAARNFTESKGYDANRYQVGGREGVADETVNRFRGQADSANQASQAYQDASQNFQNNSNALLKDARAANKQQLQARGDQARIADMMESRAQGRDLISSRVADKARAGLLGEAQSGVASARGPAGIALAQQNANNVASAGLNDVASNEMIAGAQEKLAAEQAAMGARTTMREGDQAGRAQSLAGAGNMAGAGAQYGQVGATYGGLGATYGGLENQVRSNQMGGNLAQQQNAASSLQQQQAIDSGTQQNNANRDMDYIKMALGGADGGMQAGTQLASKAPPAASDPFAKANVVQLGPLGLGGSAMSPAANTPTAQTYEVLNNGGEDVAASGKAMSDFATRFGRDPAAMPMASDPAAKEEARQLGFEQGVASVHRNAAKEQHEDSGRWLTTIPVSPLGAIPGLIQGFRSFDNDAAAEAAEKRAQAIVNKGKEPKREPKSVTREAPRALVRSEGPDRVGVPGKEGRYSEEDMVVNPSLYTPALPYPGETVEERMGFPPDYFKPRTDKPLYPPAPVLGEIPASDPRAKKLGGSASNEVADTLDKTPAVEYQYRDAYFEPDAQRPGEKQAGFLTSDLKKTRLGAAVVEERPDGYEGYNAHRMAGLQHAEIRNLHERLRAIEAGLASKKGK